MLKNFLYYEKRNKKNGIKNSKKCYFFNKIMIKLILKKLYILMKRGIKK